VAAALAPGESELVAPLDADDTRTLADALTQLGAQVTRGAGSWTVAGPVSFEPDRDVTLNVGPAGTPARFLLALLAALPGRFVLDGSARMRERPMGPLVEALRALGARIASVEREGFLPLRIEGGALGSGRVPIRGDVSSQFLSALMLVSPLVPGGIELDVKGPVASASYLALTRRVIQAFGGDSGYRATRYRVPGDDSAACFLIAGAAVSRGRVELVGLERLSKQPDAIFRDWARAAGVKVAWQGDSLVVEGPARVKAIDADVDGAPDAALPLAALLAFAKGTSRLSGAARLREKESDRLAAALDLASRAGAMAFEAPGPILVLDGPRGAPRRADFVAHGDHRVAMSAAVLALTLPEGCTLENPEVVAKSYPAFFEDWQRLLS